MSLCKGAPLVATIMDAANLSSVLVCVKAAGHKLTAILTLCQLIFFPF